MRDILPGELTLPILATRVLMEFDETVPKRLKKGWDDVDTLLQCLVVNLSTNT